MSISAITSSNVAAVYSPPVQQTQQTKAPQQAAKADTVTISAQAQKLASDGDTQAQEISESGAERAGETVRGKS